METYLSTSVRLDQTFCRLQGPTPPDPGVLRCRYTWAHDAHRAHIGDDLSHHRYGDFNMRFPTSDVHRLTSAQHVAKKNRVYFQIETAVVVHAYSRFGRDGLRKRLPTTRTNALFFQHRLPLRRVQQVIDPLQRKAAIFKKY